MYGDGKTQSYRETISTCIRALSTAGYAVLQEYGVLRRKRPVLWQLVKGIPFDIGGNLRLDRFSAWGVGRMLTSHLTFAPTNTILP